MLFNTMAPPRHNGPFGNTLLTAPAHHFLRLPSRVSCRKSGGAPLQVIGPVSTRTAAADGDGVDAAAVAVTGAVVPPLPSGPRRPDIDGAPSVPALR